MELEAGATVPDPRSAVPNPRSIPFSPLTPVPRAFMKNAESSECFLTAIYIFGAILLAV